MTCPHTFLFLPFLRMRLLYLLIPFTNSEQTFLFDVEEQVNTKWAMRGFCPCIFDSTLPFSSSSSSSFCCLHYLRAASLLEAVSCYFRPVSLQKFAITTTTFSCQVAVFVAFFECTLAGRISPASYTVSGTSWEKTNMKRRKKHDSCSA